jgi:hypothetical protein
MYNIDIVTQIKKYSINSFAQEATPPQKPAAFYDESSTQPESSIEFGPAEIGPIKPYVKPSVKPSGNQDVKKMQLAIQAFANAVVKHTLDQKGFSDFITEQILAYSPVKGVEWSTDPNLRTIQQKRPQETNLLELNIVMDSLQRIGNRSSELIADGIWKEKTNNALLNTFALAYALVLLYKKFKKVEPDIFGNYKLADMRPNIYPKDTDFTKVPADASARAKKLLPLLVSLLDFFNNIYVPKVSHNPYWVESMQGKPMYTIKSVSTPEPETKILSPNEIKMQKSPKDYHIGPLSLTDSNGRPSQKEVTLNVLQSVDELKKLAVSLGFDEDRIRTYPEIFKNLIAELKNHIVKTLDSAFRIPAAAINKGK